MPQAPFLPPTHPFDLIEMRTDEVLPRTYTREELLHISQLPMASICAGWSPDWSLNVEVALVRNL